MRDDSSMVTKNIDVPSQLGEHIALPSKLISSPSHRTTIRCKKTLLDEPSDENSLPGRFENEISIFLRHSETGDRSLDPLSWRKRNKSW